ncbi:hypothetical protein COHA_007733 [Chlorella ohadii]|uniref:monogalactosyldiacylglycerol synthase n=1 Tax=Chlorella ohadii TaxID=2649997 RepID=A0AAD5DMJ5_9CHLO|nr:hypothetical protein COHA_007733 [Chlorella ohadii]
MEQQRRSLPPLQLASTSLSLGGSRQGLQLPGCGLQCGTSDAASRRQPPTCSAGGGGGGSKRSGQARGTQQGSGSGGKGGARFNFSSRAIRFGIGAGGGAAAFFGGSGLAHAHPLWPLRPAAGAPKQPRDGKTRVLILMSDTGGGHRASAEALKAGFEELYGDKYHVDVLDIWTHHTPYPFNQMPKTYSFLVKYGFLWRAAFNAWQPRVVHVPCSTASSVVVGRRVSEAFDIYQPDLVVSVHPLMQHVPLRIMRMRIKNGMQPPTNFATVVTDLTTCHNTWFHPGVDRCYVATEASLNQALRLGLKREQLRLYGLPIRPAFGRAFPAKPKLRKALGMALDKPAILLVGGGEGMGPVEKTVDGVARHIGADCQLVVICGRNAKLVEKLKNKEYPAGMHVLIKGFVTNMPELMSASDVIITKAGPGTISEALICGLPMVLNAFVPCQEEGNIPYVTENKVGVFEKSPERAAKIIRGWFGERRAEFEEMGRRCKAIAKPHALFDICRDLNTLVR